MTELFVEIDPRLWSCANATEDEMATKKIPSMRQALLYIFALQNRRKICDEIELNGASLWTDVWNVLFQMLHRFPEKNFQVVPYIFTTRLSLDTVVDVLYGKRSDRFDETTYPASTNQNALHYLFGLARKIDREPENYMFGFIFSMSDMRFLPVCATYCGMLRNAKFEEALEQFADRIRISG